jgi:hypothetical protein
MVKMEAYYGCQLARSKALTALQKPKDNARKVTPEKTVKFAEKATEEKPALSKPCAGHLGSQLGAVRHDGRPYKCVHGAGCTFRHVSIAAKSDQRLHDLISTMPAVAQADLRKAIGSKK